MNHFLNRKKSTEPLTYEEEYEIKVNLEVEKFECEYAGCGTHKMKLKVQISLEDLQQLFDDIKKCKGIQNKIGVQSSNSFIDELPNHVHSSFEMVKICSECATCQPIQVLLSFIDGLKTIHNLSIKNREQAVKKELVNELFYQWNTSDKSKNFEKWIFSLKHETLLSKETNNG